MVIMDILKAGPDRRLQLVRVTIKDGLVICKDDTIRRKVEALKDPRGPSGADPDKDWTLARECKQWMAARIVKHTPQGNGKPPGNGVVP